MRSTKRILDPKSKFPNEIQGHVTHTPFEDDDVKACAKEYHKTDETDIRKFTSNSDTYDVFGDEYDDVDIDYLK